MSQKIAAYQANQTRHQMHQTDENMHFHENTDSENDTEVIESQFTPYTGEPIAPSDYAAIEDDEDDDGLAADSS